MILLLELPRS